MPKMNAPFWCFALCFLYACFNFETIFSKNNTLTTLEMLKERDTLISANQRYVLGFFNDTSMRKFLGIWYNGVTPSTYVWIANRDWPLIDAEVELLLIFGGGLLIQDSSGRDHKVFLPDVTIGTPVLQLLDDGNLVVRDDRNKSLDRYFWQSFEHPSDTLLPGMELGWDFGTNVSRVLKSWKALDDPTNGSYEFGINSPKSPELVVRKGRDLKSRWGPWNGERLSGTSSLRPNSLFIPRFGFSSSGVYFKFNVRDDSVVLRLVLNPTGDLQFLKWKNSTLEWVSLLTLNADRCDNYGACGPYGICYPSEPTAGCQCLEGFKPAYPDEWNEMDYSDGCERNYNLNCTEGDNFLVYSDLKLPGNSIVWGNFSIKECKTRCSDECSCMAFTTLDIYGNGSQCVVWLDDLFDMQHVAVGGDQIYVRVAHHELEARSYYERKKEEVALVSVVGATGVGMLVMLLICFILRRLSKITKALKKRERDETEAPVIREAFKCHDDESDFHLYDMNAIASCTDNFSSENKLGQGGFADVYKGTLPSGEPIAVKKLKVYTPHKEQEFKMEVTIISKLQHINLTKLLGFAFGGEDRVLIYEYLINKSLDLFIFDQAKKIFLPWQKRFNILKEVAKGLVYLHYDSRVKIIHRDLKPSNILLDEEMSAKIADFGLARIYEELDPDDSTRRVIGTYGYMSPEYMATGAYSTKSDVFSLGVVILEVISGQKNWGYDHPDNDLNLIGHTWNLWNEGRAMEILDPVLEDTFVEGEILQCIHVALLCVQKLPEDRPETHIVATMLQNDDRNMIEPKEPGFFVNDLPPPVLERPPGWEEDTSNRLTFSIMSGR